MRVAVLYQVVEPPIINSIRKPIKPGGYQDSGADIAFNLQAQPGICVVTPCESPDPADSSKWCFPDTEEGILYALQKGATHLWANTILFASHPLQNGTRLDEYQDRVRIVGQPPNLVEQFDDKDYVNSLLSRQGGLTMPQAWTVSISENMMDELAAMNLPYPVVGKPIRGRGSYGVKLCHTLDELLAHVTSLFEDSPSIMIEEFLSGEEATITVMPPSSEKPYYWAMPIITRFNHDGGIAPYNGVVAVTSNSKVVRSEEYAKDRHYDQAARQCETVAKFLRVTAPIRIDIRRFFNDKSSQFALFDVNMKPNMTGPGRPGRENQASLTAMAAAEVGWDYPKLLAEMLDGAVTLRHLRQITLDVK